MSNSQEQQPEGAVGEGRSTVAEVSGGRKSSNGPNYLKLVVHNLVAGSIIGKNGSVIAALENETGSSIKLSPSQCFFPHTEDRVALISGTEQEVEAGFVAILSRIQEVHFNALGAEVNLFAKDVYTPERGRTVIPQQIQVRLAVPKTAIAAVIGRSGQNIKALQHTTGARVQVSSRDDNLPERVITITGSYEEVKQAGLSINSIIQQDSTHKVYTHLVYAMKGSAAPGGYPGYLGPAQPFYNGFQPPQSTFGAVRPGQFGNAPPGYGGSQADVMNTTCEISLSIPDSSVGGVIGKKGGTVVEIMKLTGTMIKISQKGEYISDKTQERKCVIRGTVGAVHNAHVMLLQRLELQQQQRQNPKSSEGTFSQSSGIECFGPDVPAPPVMGGVPLPRVNGVPGMPQVFGMGVTPGMYPPYDPTQA